MAKALFLTQLAKSRGHREEYQNRGKWQSNQSLRFVLEREWGCGDFLFSGYVSLDN
jgi:hypothetical protein